MFQFLVAFAKLRKATITFAVSVHPPVEMQQLGSYWTDYILVFFQKHIEKIQVSLKSGKYIGYFT